MNTNTTTLSAPVGVAPSGETLTVDLRRHSNLLMAGFAGSGKSTLLRLIADALELQVAHNGRLLYIEGIRVGVEEAITEVHDELLRRQRGHTPNEERGPIVLCVDDFGVWSEHSASPESLAMLRRVALTGRGHDIHLVLATQSVTGISTDLLTAMSIRIVLGRVFSSEYSRLFSEVERPRVAEVGANIQPGDIGMGVMVDEDGEVVPFTTGS